MSRPKNAERVYGWWNFDESRMTLFEAGSTSRLRFLGQAENDSELDLKRSNVRQWFRFDAELEGFTYPLLVEVRYCRRPSGDRVPVWRLDHIRSAALAAKAGVVEYTRCLAEQLRSYDINVNTLAPGDTRTGRFLGSRKVDEARLVTEGTLDRIGMVDEVTRVVEFFAGPLGAFVTGQVLRVDGGSQIWAN